jgi:hypothetical protein
MEQPQFVEQTEPEEVFGLLSDDNRVAILRALWSSDGPMTFSALHDAVDIRDSGQFNYHLDKLVGQFVTRSEAGYELATAGAQINGAIEAGSYTVSGSMEPIQFDDPCPTCGGTRTFYYEDETARVDCDSCSVKAQFTIPPSAFVGCDRGEIPDVAGEYRRAIIERLDRGFCGRCDGPAELAVCPVVDSPAWDEPEDEDVGEGPLGDPGNIPIVKYECLQCGAQPTSGLRYALLTHPEVVGFYYDRGVDIRARSLWEFTTFGTDHEQVRSTDPFRASTTFTADGDELTLVVDEEMRVVEREIDEAA